jgi:hypothetical protein
MKKAKSTKRVEQWAIVSEFRPARRGTDSDPANPLMRALDDLMLFKGRPTSALAAAYILDETSPKPTCRWLGVFVHTDGDRVLFFPGLSVKHGASLFDLAPRPGKRAAPIPFAVDHISLDANRVSSHVTSFRSREHHAVPPVRSLRDDCVRWFGMNVRATTILRPVKTKTVLRADLPSTDSQRRVDSFRRATEHSSSVLLHLPPGERAVPGFLHVTAIVGPARFKPFDGSDAAIPTLAPLHDGVFLPPEGWASSRSRLSLGPRIDIEFISIWFAGKLRDDVGFSFGL